MKCLNVTRLRTSNENRNKLHMGTMRLHLKPIIEASTKWEVPNVTESCVHIRINFTTRLLPTTAECVVLGEVSTVTWVNHTVKSCVIVIKVSVLMVVLTPQFGKLLLKGLEYRASNHHETCGSIENLDKSILNRAVVRSKVDNETRREHGHVTFISLLDSICSLIPHDNLLGVACDREVMTRFDETYNSLGVKMDVGIYEHEVVTVSLLHESSDGNITGTVNEGFILGGIQIHLNTLLDEKNLKFDDTGHVLLETQTAIAWCREKQFRHFKYYYIVRSKCFLIIVSILFSVGTDTEHFSHISLFVTLLPRTI